MLRSPGIDRGATWAPGTLSTGAEPEDPPRVRCLKLLLETTDREAGQDWGGAIAALRTALNSGMAAEDRDVWANLGNMALHLGDDAAHRTFFTHMLAAARTDGAVMEVLYALHRLCFSQYAAGDWSAVRRSADEAVSLARSIGQPAQSGTPLAVLSSRHSLSETPAVCASRAPKTGGSQVFLVRGEPNVYSGSQLPGVTWRYRSCVSCN